jgi:hypothetical protein
LSPDAKVNLPTLSKKKNGVYLPRFTAFTAR